MLAGRTAREIDEDTWDCEHARKERQRRRRQLFARMATHGAQLSRCIRDRHRIMCSERQNTVCGLIPEEGVNPI